MSGTLKKSPSEGDISSSFEINSEEESSQSKKDSFHKSNYHPPDFKRGFLANSGFRLVWKSSNQEDITNLNKVLDLPQEPKRPRSTSPSLPQSIQAAHVFSEYFDPLAVHKRDTTDSKDKDSEDMKGVPSTENMHTSSERKRTGNELEILKLPSVKLLKSKFESSEKKEEVIVRKPKPFKRSHTLSGHEVSSLKLAETKNDIYSERRHSTSTKYNLSENTGDKTKKTDSTEKPHSNLRNENINDNVKNHSSNVKKSSIPVESESVHRVEGHISITKTSSAAVESDSVRKVKDLLVIFQKLEKSKSVPTNLNEYGNKNASRIRQGQETVKNVNSKYNSVTEIKIVDTDKTFENVSVINNQNSSKYDEIPEKAKEKKIQHEDDIEVPSLPSVFNLRQKWENISSINTKMENINKETRESTTYMPSKHQINMKETDLAKEKNSLKLDLNFQAELDAHTNSSVTENNVKSISSVKALTLNYETNKIREIKSAPSTPSVSKETFINVATSTSPSHFSNNKIHNYQQSQLQNMKQFSTETYVNQNSKVEMKQSTDDRPEEIILENQKEISLGSFQRQSSVKKIKEKYETKLSLTSSSSTKATEIETNETRVKTSDIIETSIAFEIHKEISLGSLQRQASVSKMKEKYESQPHSQSLLPSTTCAVEEATKQVKTTESIETNRSEQYKEMSLGSLQRQASVSKIKEKYESQPHSQSLLPSTTSAVEEATKHVKTTEILEPNRAELHKEMSLGSLQRQAPVSKIKDKYESQSQSQSSLANIKSASEETPKQMKPKEIGGMNKTLENYKEMSLGSLQRQSSVTKMKERYELQQHSHNSSSNIKRSSEIEESLSQVNKIKSSEAIQTNIYLESKKEMSLGSLERQASVTKMKEKYDSKDEKQTTSTDMKSTRTVEDLQHVNNISSTRVVETEAKKTSTFTNKTDINKTNESTIKKFSDERNTYSSKSELKSTEENTSGNDYENDNYQDEKSKKKSKIEELVESFMKSEGISKYIEIQKEGNLSSQSESKYSDVSTLMETKETNKFSDIYDKEISKETNKSEKSSVTKEFNKKSSSSKMVKTNASSQIIRSGSRELKPDELKYFQSLPYTQDPNGNSTKRRERSNSFDSSSASSTLSKEDLSRSKLRSSSRQYRDLHKDELKFFDSKINGTMSKISFRNSSELALRQEVLEKSVRSSTFENGERKE